MSAPRARSGRKPARSRSGGAKPSAPGQKSGAKTRPAKAPAAGAKPAPPGPRREPRQPVPEPPPSVRNAIRAMYLGAAITFASLMASMLGASSFQAAVHRVHPTWTQAQVRAFTGSAVTFELIAGLVFLVGWIGMIWASRRGHSWVRGMAGVLLFYNTAILGLGLLQGVSVGTLLSVAIWLAGLAAAVLLWRKESSEYFRTARTP